MIYTVLYMIVGSNLIARELWEVDTLMKEQERIVDKLMIIIVDHIPLIFLYPLYLTAPTLYSYIALTIMSPIWIPLKMIRDYQN